MKMRTKQEAGSTEYSYTIDQLKHLRRCVEHNPDSLAIALAIFFKDFDYIPDDSEILDLWLRHAEGIKDNSNYIDELIARTSESAYCVVSEVS